MSNDSDRPTPQEAGRAGCELLLLVILLVVGLLGFPAVMMTIAPLDQVTNDNETVQQIGD